MATVLINGSHPHWMVTLRGPLIRAMVARGHIVHVSSPDVEQFRDALQGLGATAHEVPLARTGQSVTSDLRYAHAMLQLIRKLRPDYVLSYTIKPNIWGTLASATLGIPAGMMVTGLGYAFLDQAGVGSRITQLIARRLYRAAARRAQAVVFQNPDDLRDFVGAGCLSDPGKALLVNGSGVDTEHFSPAALPDGPIFLLIARLLRSKGVEEYARASAAVRAKVPAARFLLAGPLEVGPDAATSEELDDWIRQGLEYLGPLEDVRPAIASCSTYVLPSWREGTPRTVLEAMAMARPIITTDAPGCRETTRHGANGLLVPVADPDALASAMLELALDPELRQKMGQQSRSMAEERYAVAKVNAVLLGGLGL